MFKKSFVVVDLETSGTDPKLNQIIEIALIRYENGREVARYDQLIKIDSALPQIIIAITGITDDLLKKEGQPFDEVKAEVAALLKGAYIIGHNIKFDVGFLKNSGFELEVPGLIDTVPLAQIVFPEAASYSLESLAEDLEISHESSHRAMADVKATLALFQAILKRIESLPSAVIADIQKYVKRSQWEGGVVFENMQGNGEVIKTQNFIPLSKNALPQVNPQKPLDVDVIFQENGMLKKVLQGYEYRRQQLEMAQNVMNAFEQGYHLICEAPTGVGKSMAYLAAAANITLSNKSKVVISTNTINLQQQLFEKDILLLQQLYQHQTGNAGVRVALLKGRSHYLCLRRFSEFKRRPRFTTIETIVLIKILIWQAISTTGDSAEIHLTKDERFVWDFELCSDKKFCSPHKCKPFGECYLHKARESAELADIIIVNHALLCADLESGGGLLPDYQYLVIDEAHHFEEVATKAFGTELTQENLMLPIKLVRNHLEDFKRRHGMGGGAGQAQLFRVGSEIFESIDNILADLPDLEQFVDNFFSVVALFVNRNVPESAYIEKLLVDQIVLGMPDWLNLGSSMEEATERLKNWLSQLKQLLDQLLMVDDVGFKDQDEFTDELLQEISIMQEQLDLLNQFFEEDLIMVEKKIRWMSSNLHGNVSLHMAPLLVGPLLAECLYAEKKSVIFTSATLSVRLESSDVDESDQQPFQYLRRMLSLGENFEEIVLDSPFDFEAQAYVMLPTDALPLTATKSMEQLSVFFTKLIGSVRGGMLGLFTSYAAIKTLYLGIHNHSDLRESRVLAQRISGGRNKVMKAYLKNPQKSVLFGTASFWEGVDIQGDALTTLVIHKLPFDVPSNPIFKARQELFNNSFMEYSVPRAILKFKQGFGRLIRSAKDYGCLIVLDNRVTTKRYGQLFLDALPPGITIENAPLADIPGKVEEWLKLSGQ